MSRQQTIVVVTDSGGEQTLTVQDFSEDTQAEYYTQPFDEAIDGSLRSNLRGLRKSFEVNYRLCGDPETYRDICNNIATDLQNGLEFVYVGIDNSNLFRVVLDDDFAHKAEYANQHGLFVPNISFKGYEVDDDAVINIEFEDWRFITESVTQARDYGLITDAVTTQLDYGTLG